jgi:hypothetical protein
MDGKATGINSHMDFTDIARYRFADSHFLSIGRSATMLMRFHNASVIKFPFQIRLYCQFMKNSHQFFFTRPLMEAFLNRIPVSKDTRQIPPRTTDAQAIKNPFDDLAKKGFGINLQFQHNLFLFLPEFVRKHLSWHRFFIFAQKTMIFEAGLGH